jgi:hypothetical protein
MFLFFKFDRCIVCFVGNARLHSRLRATPRGGEIVILARASRREIVEWDLDLLWNGIWTFCGMGFGPFGRGQK